METDPALAAAVLVRLRDHIGDAFTLTENRTPGELVADHLARLALERCITFIAAAIARVPAAWKAELPDIPWADIAGVGENLDDPSRAVDVEHLWQVVEKDLPPLEAAIGGLIERASATRN